MKVKGASEKRSKKETSTEMEVLELVMRTERPRPPMPQRAGGVARNCQGDLGKNKTTRYLVTWDLQLPMTLKEARGLALETVKLSTHQRTCSRNNGQAVHTPKDLL